MTATLSNADPGTTLVPGSRSYDTIPAGAQGPADFTLTLAASFPLGKPVSLAARSPSPGRCRPPSTR